ncbi:MAG: arsenate reductase ArsC [Acidobacteriota bacterium]
MVRTVATRRVLILCTGNSCRSQMAEGWINHLLGDRWLARSAGTRPAEAVHPLAVRVMAEVGVDLGTARPRNVSEFVDEAWDLVVTVCDAAKESCPIFPRPVEQIHLGFPDPALAEGDEERRLAVFRTVRDAIRENVVPELERRNGDRSPE